jgi:hypothetical protein
MSVKDVLLGPITAATKPVYLSEINLHKTLSLTLANLNKHVIH